MLRRTAPTTRERAIGALVGLAVGDALGTTLEFRTPGSFAPLHDMVGGGPFQLDAGQWTDDTSMALCLGESLLHCRGHNRIDQLTRYVRWWRHGHWSSRPGECFDIGMTVRHALGNFERGGAGPWAKSGEFDAGNGSIMRLAPVAMYWHRDASTAIAMAAESSRTTHGATAAIDACRYLAALIVGAISGVDKQTLLAPMYSPSGEAWTRGALHAAVAKVAAGSFREKQPPAIRGTGYVVDSLEAALWAFASTEDFASGALAAVNLGEDADTTGAVYGQIAGAYYGVGAIPLAWRERIARGMEIVAMAEALTGGASV